ncbi:uncharacterized protein LOC123540454 isoform X2 [Mercenaria mercenaria]|uniref:uncharacterized protein LOC123540454 isoform X2 n=1 Tax=Mercenaria mercenaria TaxID=6596 RepID=UPI00234E512D|nr:uncharacterized protein LOC123540454 isoform X2 [Mercenaria mercenaria]
MLLVKGHRLELGRRMAGANKRSDYKSWVKGSLGFQYLKYGLVGFCEEIVTKQYEEILNDIKQNKKLLKLVCGQCSIDTLRPDHVQNMSKHCPLGQIQCNCQSPSGKVSCRNKLCGAIYDKIITLHASIPPSPNWQNTNLRDWCTNPWEIAKCFISQDGYAQTKTAFDTDCTGILSIFMNATFLRSRISQTELFTQLQRARNDLLYSALHELDENLADKYFDVMIAVLQDVQELNTRRESKGALRRIKELKSGRYSYNSEDEISVLEDSCERITNELFRRGVDVHHHQLKAIDRLNAFELYKMGRREITRIMLYLKDILSKSTSQKPTIHELEELFQSSMQRLGFLKQTGDATTMNTSLSMQSISSTSKPSANVKLFVVKDSCFPRYEYAMENVIDILKRYKNVFSLSNNGEPVSREIAFYFCKANNEIDFPCDINDIVPDYSELETYHKREFSSLCDCLRKRDKSIFSVFVASGDMEELWESESHQEAIYVICPRSGREERAILKRQSLHSRENVLIIRKETAREQVESYLEKSIFHELNPVCEALFKNIEYASFKRRHEHVGDDDTFATKTKLPGKRKGMCETTGYEEKTKKIRRSGGKKTTESIKDKHGNKGHAIMAITTQTTAINKSAEDRNKSASIKKVFSKTTTATCFTTSHKGEGKGPQQLSNLMKVNEEVLHTVNEQTKECLLEELIGLYNMSSVSVQEMPNIPQHRDKVDLETLSKDLFAQCPTVTGVGYRMRKLQVAVKDIQNFDTPDKRTEISNVLDRYNIQEYEIVPMSLKGYLTPGDEIHVAHKRGSFGCFAKMKDKKDTSETPCGLLSKHVATTDHQKSEIFAEKDGQFRRVGHILQETITEEGLDIAAATLSIPLEGCETRFKSLRGRPQETGRGKFTSTERLRGNKVHMWGAVSKPGKGIITVPDFICKGMDHTLIQVEDIVDGEQKVVERFAQQGDSGAVTCVDDPGQNVVHPVSMNMGCMNYNEVEKDNRKKVKTERGKYLTVPLQSGLAQLGKRTGKNFDLY